MNDLSHTPAVPAPVIKRVDYSPPEWLVPEIALDFALSLTATRVRAELVVERTGEASGPLRLDGDGIAAKSVLVDGSAHNDWRMEEGQLVINRTSARHTVTIETEIDPAGNTQLSGLYASNGMLCTQCEAQGFRRITFFPDRPDVLSRYTVRKAGDKAAFPVLLSNGNPIASGENADGTLWAEWHDPWP